MEKKHYVCLMKIMAQGKKDAKGTSFMEDYTYNLVPGKEGILEARYAEVCLDDAKVQSASNASQGSGDWEPLAKDWCLHPR